MKDEFSILIDSHAVNMSSSDDRWRLPDNLKCSFNIVFQDHVDNVVPLCGMMRHVHMNVYMFKPIKVTRTNIITTTITHTKKNTTKWFRRKQTVSHKRHEPQPLPTFHVKPTSSCFEETPMYIYIFIRCWLSAGFCWLTSCHVVPFKKSPFDGYPLALILH